jgi:hypothetical protein
VDEAVQDIDREQPESVAVHRIDGEIRVSGPRSMKKARNETGGGKPKEDDPPDQRKSTSVHVLSPFDAQLFGSAREANGSCQLRFIGLTWVKQRKDAPVRQL